MLQPALREGNWKVTCAVYVGRGRAEARIVQVWPGFYEGHIYGVAVDVGSTTIACHLCDLVSGEVKASAGIMNPQIRFGEDLMSRVSYSMMNPTGAAEMTRAVREALNALIGQVAAEARIDRTEVLEGVLVGNPVMHHLFLGIDPKELGWAPFALASSDSLTLWASEIDLRMHPDARIYVLPCIAGHVGADAAAVMLSEAPHRQDEMMLVVDVGTNAEIVLGNRERVLACSSPTGPAFEGAQISSGQRAAPGAIERVRIDPATREPRFRVIGSDLWSNDPAFGAESARGVTGICGSGIIEVIAEMRLAGLVNEDGVILPRAATGSERVVEEGRTWSYVLHDGRAKGGPLITVTQADVRAIQLAKAALYAGARLLMDRMGVETVERIVLAGAFGAHISPLHAMVLGMIPDCPLDKVASAGNAAGTGARIALLNSAARREIEHIVRTVEKVETAVEPKFQQHFVEAIAIPHKTATYPNLAGHVTIPDTPAAETPGEGEGAQAKTAAGVGFAPQGRLAASSAATMPEWTRRQRQRLGPGERGRPDQAGEIWCRGPPRHRRESLPHPARTPRKAPDRAGDAPCHVGGRGAGAGPPPRPRMPRGHHRLGPRDTGGATLSLRDQRRRSSGWTGWGTDERPAHSPPASTASTRRAATRRTISACISGRAP